MESNILGAIVGVSAMFLFLFCIDYLEDIGKGLNSLKKRLFKN